MSDKKKSERAARGVKRGRHAADVLDQEIEELLDDPIERAHINGLEQGVLTTVAGINASLRELGFGVVFAVGHKSGSDEPYTFTPALDEKKA